MPTDSDPPAGGLRSQVKPTFMAPAVGMSAFGALLAPTLAPVLAVIHALAVGTALYTAHLVDEYVDAHVRGEDAPMLTERTARRAIAVTSLGCLGLVGALAFLSRPAAAATAATLWLLAVLHAPILDRNTVAVTVDYPLGIALALTGGHLAQMGTLTSGVVGIAVLFVVVLAAVKISIDRLDVDFDRTIDKRTIPVVLGEHRATRLSAGLFVGGGGLTAGLVVLSVLPLAALLSVPVSVAGAVAGLGTTAETAVRRQMLLVYPLAAVLFVTQCLATVCAVAPTNLL